MSPNSNRIKSKTLATWIAAVCGALGLHRFYLYGSRDVWAWLLPWPTLLGGYGVHRMQELGSDDHLAWVLIPVLGLVFAATMLTAILYGLTPDEKWNARFNAGQLAPPPAGWANILGVLLALIFGAGVLVATIAFSAQRYFEYEAEAAATSR